MKITTGFEIAAAAAALSLSALAPSAGYAADDPPQQDNVAVAYQQFGEHPVTHPTEAQRALRQQVHAEAIHSDAVTERSAFIQ